MGKNCLGRAGGEKRTELVADTRLASAGSQCLYWRLCLSLPCHTGLLWAA